MMPESLSLCFHGSASAEKLSGDRTDNGNKSLIDSVIQFIKPTCLCSEEQKLKRQIPSVDDQQQQQQLFKKAKQLTLEERFIISSPNIGMDRSRSGEHSINCRQQRSSVHPSTLGEYADNCAETRERPSLGRFLKGDDVSVEDSSFQSQCSQSMERSQIPKSKKRVSFRLPDEADVVFFHASPCDLETW